MANKRVISIQLVNDNSKEVLNAMKKQALAALKSCGQEAERYAKADCPVDTGRLRNSISNELIDKDEAVYIGTNVEYAPYVEYGDQSHKVGKKHFLRDSVQGHEEHYKAIIEAALKS